MRATGNRHHPSGDEPGAGVYPCVITTHRLTEHFTAGGMSRWSPYLSELQPEFFCELSPRLAAERGLEHGGWATIVTARNAVEARVMVTGRIRPLTVHGRTVHHRPALPLGTQRVCEHCTHAACPDVCPTPACAKACPTESIQFGPLDELRERAALRVEQLHEAGVPAATLYGEDPGDGVGGDGAFFLLLDTPEVYGLPPDPVVTTRDLPARWKHAGMAALSLAAVSLSAAALVNDLGRPSGFANMLRVFKPTSPMSMGSWLLAAVGVRPLRRGRRCLRRHRANSPAQERRRQRARPCPGPALAAYTAVLAADTAVPAWHGAHRELPYVFVASATAAASGMALVLSPPRESAPARYAAVRAATGDLTAMAAAERRLGMVAATYREGRAGTLLRCARPLTVAGAAGAALFGGRSRAAAAGSGALLLAGSACTRFGVFAAGVASVKDPAYTVVPQREAREKRDGTAMPGH